MCKLKNDAVKANPLLSRFLEKPTQEGLNILLTMDYRQFLSLMPSVSALNLIQFLSSINHLEGLHYLSTHLPFFQIQDMVKANEYYAFRFAAENGHLAVLHYLVELTPDLLPKMLKTHHYYAFCVAAGNGHLDVLHYLTKLAKPTPDLLPKMMKTYNYHAFCVAAAKGHLAVLHYLVELTPDLLPEMLKASYYYAINQAVAHNHYPAVYFLLEKDKTLYNQLAIKQKKSFNEARFNASFAHHYLRRFLLPDMVPLILNQTNYVRFFKPIETFLDKPVLGKTPNLEKAKLF